MAIGVTEVIGSTPSTLTSLSCSTKAKIALSSPRRCSTSSSATPIRARCAMRRTVAASTDMRSFLAAKQWRAGYRSEPAAARATWHTSGTNRDHGPASAPPTFQSREASFHGEPVVLTTPKADIVAMDAPNPSAVPTLASRTPLHIGAIGLVARDLDKLAGFYQHLLGLTALERTDKFARLGTAGGVSLIEIEHRADALPDDKHDAGLYHTAFLMPTRQDHAHWILHIARARTPITGASDHGVSEAFYLDDPEGNGIEVYNDRPPERWQRDGDMIVMPTKPLDVEAIVREDGSDAGYTTAPEGLRIGHVHLRVGNVERAEEFYRGPVGLDLTRRRGGATFMSSGGYHHHVGANVWHSDGAGPRDPKRAGLAWFSMELAEPGAVDAMAERLRAAHAPVEISSGGIETADPWGTRIRFVKA